MSTEAPLYPRCYIFSDADIRQRYGISGRRMKLSQEELRIHSTYFNRVVEFTSDPEAVPDDVVSKFSDVALQQQIHASAFSGRKALYVFYDIDDIHTSPSFNHLLRSTAYYNITVWVVTPDHSSLAHLIDQYSIEFYTPTWPRVLSWGSCASTASSASMERKLTDQK